VLVLVLAVAAAFLPERLAGWSCRGRSGPTAPPPARVCHGSVLALLLMMMMIRALLSLLLLAMLLEEGG
jgi:hypothetical protein